MLRHCWIPHFDRDCKKTMNIVGSMHISFVVLLLCSIEIVVTVRDIISTNLRMLPDWRI